MLFRAGGTRKSDGIDGRREPVGEDQFDVDLEDEELLEEVELTTDLIVAASETDERLPQDRIDEILGVPKPRSGDSSNAPT